MNPTAAVHGPKSRITQPSGRARDAGLFALAFAVCWWVYQSHPQPWLWGDGFSLYQGMHEADGLKRYGLHVAYTSLARAVQALVHGLSDDQALHTVSAVAGALGSASTFLLARSMGAQRTGALIATALVATTPAVWFFATAIEVHTVHMAAVGLFAWVTWHLPWHRPTWALLATAVLLALLPATHLSAPLLGPPWVLLVALARGKRLGRAPDLRWTAMAGGVLALAMASGLWVVQRLRTAGVDPLALESVQRQIDDFPGGSGWHWWRDEIGNGLYLLVPFALMGLWSLRKRRWLVALIVFTCSTQLAFHAWWGVPNLGGYFVVLAPALGAATAAGWEHWRMGSRSFAAAGWLLVLALLPAAWRTAQKGAASAMATYELVDRNERTSQVRRAIGDEGVLISFDAGMQSITRILPGVREVSLTFYGSKLVATPRDSAVVVAEVLQLLEGQEWDESSTIAWDASYRPFLPHAPLLAKHMLALESALVERYEVDELPHPHWPMLRLRKK